MKKEVNDELLDKVSGGFSAEMKYSFNKGDTFEILASEAPNHKDKLYYHIVIEEDYIDVSGDTNIYYSYYQGSRNQAPIIRTCVPAEEIANNYTFIGNNVSW